MTIVLTRLHSDCFHLFHGPGQVAFCSFVHVSMYTLVHNNAAIVPSTAYYGMYGEYVHITARSDLFQKKLFAAWPYLDLVLEI